jgi:dual specificity phosphatase 12
MSMILENLYVSGLEEAYKDEHLKSNVSHFLNVASELMIVTRVDHGYKKIGIKDDDINSDIRSILLDCINWIDDIIKEGGSVCIHCLEGKSRSVCVCIAYLCCKQNWDFNEAYQLIRTQRPSIDIYPRYLEQLRMYIKGY